MAVKLTLIDQTENGPEFIAEDLATGEVVSCKNWFEKSKDKWHIVLGANSANRKYVAHNEFFAKAQDGEYVVEDKTTGPRVLGTAQPDKHLVPYMSEEDKAAYDAIIARAIENRNEQKAKPLTEEEKLLQQIEKYKKKIADAQKKLEETANDDDDENIDEEE